MSDGGLCVGTYLEESTKKGLGGWREIDGWMDDAGSSGGKVFLVFSKPFWTIEERRQRTTDNRAARVTFCHFK